MAGGDRIRLDSEEPQRFPKGKGSRFKGDKVHRNSGGKRKPSKRRAKEEAEEEWNDEDMDGEIFPEEE